MWTLKENLPIGSHYQGYVTCVPLLHCLSLKKWNKPFNIIEQTCTWFERRWLVSSNRLVRKSKFVGLELSNSAPIAAERKHPEAWFTTSLLKIDNLGWEQTQHSEVIGIHVGNVHDPLQSQGTTKLVSSKTACSRNVQHWWFIIERIDRSCGGRGAYYASVIVVWRVKRLEELRRWWGRSVEGIERRWEGGSGFRVR